MKLLYITARDFDHGKKDGVVKKIYSQIECFEKNGYTVDLIHMMKADKSVRFVTGDITEVSAGKTIGNYKKLSGINGKKIISHFLKEHLKHQKYDYVYIRFLNGRNDPWTIDILKAIKTYNIPVILEIPTYPYEGEKKNFMARADLLLDRIYRKKLKNYIKRIVTFSEDDEIFGIKTLPVKNGINVESVKVIEPLIHDDNELNIMAVALFQKYHGYERIIQGVANYVKAGGNRKITVHMVGDGSERKSYEELAVKNGISDNIIFYGRKAGEEIDAIYNKTDIALGSMGYYKNNLETSSNLKIREYLSKGLPFVTGCREDIFDNNEKDFYLRIPNDASPVNMEKVIEWYDGLINKYGSKQELIHTIRQFAKENADAAVTFMPVIDYMKTEE